MKPYRHMEEAALRKLGRMMTPNYTGRRVAVWDPNKRHWSFDPAHQNGEVRFTKQGKLGKRRRKRKVVEYDNPAIEKLQAQIRKLEAIGRKYDHPKIEKLRQRIRDKQEPKQRKVKLVQFKVGDYVLFNPARKGHPTCIDGEIVKVRRCYDRRSQEFIERFTIAQTDAPFRWTVRYPGVAIKRIPNPQNSKPKPRR